MITRFQSLGWRHQVMLIAMLSILYIYSAGFLGAMVLQKVTGNEHTDVEVLLTVEQLPNLFIRWDAGYYLVIAREGYPPDSNRRAFFPLYPMLARLGSALFQIPIPWSGMLLSAIAFIATGMVLYKWVLIDFNHHDALLTVLVLYTFPMAFFFLAFYAEPLLLFTSVASFYFARRGRFVLSGLMIALAGATRPTAVLLAIPYLIEFLQQRNFSWLSWLRFVVGAIIAPLGMLAYLAFLAQQSGSFDLIATYAAVGDDLWLTHQTWPWQVLASSLKAAFFGAGINSDWFSRVLVWHNLAYALAALVIAGWSVFRMRASSSVFMVVGIFYLCSFHGPHGYAFWSLPRRIAVLVPIYLAMALLFNKLSEKPRWVTVAISAVMLGVLSAWFASGRWVA